MNTQLVYIDSAVTGIIAGAVLAFVVILFATTQVIIATAALITIGGILGIVLASMVVAGFQLGTITSICITLLAGFSVDYVVHLAHAFEHSPAPTRAEKFQDAMAEMGVAVFSGMLTSGLAAATLFLCQLQFFSKFGFFLLVTVVASWIMASCFFMTILHVVGPDDNTPAALQFPANVICKSRVRTPGSSTAVKVEKTEATEGDLSAASA
jgi:predicted RND superfamily exporter protein